VAQRPWRTTHRATGVVTWLALAAVVLLTGISLTLAAVARKPLSMIDEHVHLGYAVTLHEGHLPYRGALYPDGVIEEWACGVGHEAGPLPVACGSPDLSADVLPSGRYSTAYIHYPTYFAAGEVWRAVFERVVGDGHAPVTVYRLFSMLCLLAGVGAGIAVARSLGLRGSRLAAASLLPIAAPLVLYLGVIVNPGSAALLNGVLIAGAGIRWMRTGRGFGWLALASAFASLTAVTHSLPVGAFMLAVLAALVGKRWGWRLDGPWRPRWGHLAALGAIVLVPVVVWGRVIAARATVSNGDLFSSMAPTHPATVVTGFFFELAGFHSPWTEIGHFWPGRDEFVTGALRAVAAGLPFWLGALVIGALLLMALRVLPRRAFHAADGDGVVAAAAAPGAVPVHPAVTGRTATYAAEPRTGAVAVAVMEPLTDPLTDWVTDLDSDHAAESESDALAAAPSTRRLDPLHLLVVCALATFVLYAPALRVSNVLNFGMDFPVVGRYSIGLMPLFAYLVALLVPSRVLIRLLAVAAGLVVVGTSVWWL
jgi:hypothetical protein